MTSRFDTELITVAGRDPDEIDTMIRSPYWVRAVSSAGKEAARDGKMLGLLLLGGDNDRPFPDNPWNIPADAGLSRALRHVWEPVATDCPRFIAALHEEVFGLGLIRNVDTWLLVYLYLDGHDGRAGVLTDLAELPSRREHGLLGVLWGEMPISHDPHKVVAALGEPAPEPIRRLAAVHSALGGRTAELNLSEFSAVSLGDSIREDYKDEDPGDYEPDEEFSRALRGEFDRCLPLGRFEGRTDYLDLDSRDPDGTPRVTDVDHQEGVGENTTSLWTWFDESATCFIFDRD